MQECFYQKLHYSFITQCKIQGQQWHGQFGVFNRNDCDWDEVWKDLETMQLQMVWCNMDFQRCKDQFLSKTIQHISGCLTKMLILKSCLNEIEVVQYILATNINDQRHVHEHCIFLWSLEGSEKNDHEFPFLRIV